MTSSLCINTEGRFFESQVQWLLINVGFISNKSCSEQTFTVSGTEIPLIIKRIVVTCGADEDVNDLKMFPNKSGDD